MARELMWVCAIAPEEFREEVTRLCLSENKSIGLPENVFKLPLHISLKKSFYTEDFASVKDDILKIINGIGRFRCHIDRICLQRDMLWLSLLNAGDLQRLHTELDRQLSEKHGVPIGNMTVFFSHISVSSPVV